MKVEAIENDLYFIASRLKEIDDGYFILRRNGRYEIHNSRQRGGTFALSVPYGELDDRTVTLVRRTRAERMREILEQTERSNMRLQKRIADEIAEKACIKAENALREAK